MFTTSKTKKQQIYRPQFSTNFCKYTSHTESSTVSVASSSIPSKCAVGLPFIIYIIFTSLNRILCNIDHGAYKCPP